VPFYVPSHLTISTAVIDFSVRSITWHWNPYMNIRKKKGWAKLTKVKEYVNEYKDLCSRSKLRVPTRILEQFSLFHTAAACSGMYVYGHTKRKPHDGGCGFRSNLDKLSTHLRYAKKEMSRGGAERLLSFWVFRFSYIYVAHQVFCQNYHLTWLPLYEHKKKGWY